MALGYEIQHSWSTSPSLYCIVTVNLTINTTVGNAAHAGSLGRRGCGSPTPVPGGPEPVHYLQLAPRCFLDPLPQGRACASSIVCLCKSLRQASAPAGPRPSAVRVQIAFTFLFPLLGRGFRGRLVPLVGVFRLLRRGPLLPSPFGSAVLKPDLLHKGATKQW